MKTADWSPFDELDRSSDLQRSIPRKSGIDKRCVGPDQEDRRIQHLELEPTSRIRRQEIQTHDSQRLIDPIEA